VSGTMDERPELDRGRRSGELVYLRNLHAFHTAMMRTMFHIICVRAASISFDGCVRVLVRTAEHMSFGYPYQPRGKAATGGGA
jgi:hypothetical protein